MPLGEGESSPFIGSRRGIKTNNFILHIQGVFSCKFSYLYSDFPLSEEGKILLYVIMSRSIVAIYEKHHFSYLCHFTMTPDVFHYKYAVNVH